jgi:chromosome segregation ATPase
MSWISKAESLLNNLDKKAGSVLQAQQKVDEQEAPEILVENKSSLLPASKNILVLKSSAAISKKTSSSSTKLDDWDSVSEKSIASSVRTQIDQNEKDHNDRGSAAEVFSVEKEIASTKILLSEARSENVELKMEVESLQDQLKNNSNSAQLNDLQDMINVLVDEKRDLAMMNQSLENSTSKYIKTISELESTLMKIQQSENDLKQKLEFSRNEAKDFQKELQNYKLRAQNQLQMKEKLIEQLKTGANAEIEDNGESDVPALQMEVDQLTQEREHLQSEINLLTKRLEESRSFIEKIEHKHRIMEASAEDKINALNEAINLNNLKSIQFEDEIRLNKNEIQQVRDEMLNQKKFMTMKIHEKENELKRLKNAYREKQMNSEIENRVQSLTQSLISKQNNLETITSERNALKIQLEKLSVKI